MNGIRLYLKFLRVSFRVQTMYPASFFLYAVANFAISIMDLFAIYAFFLRFKSLGQWTLGEVMIFYGITYMAFALAEAYLRGFDVIERHIRTGEFDRLLLRPRSVFLQVLGSEFQLLRIGRFINGVIPFAAGLSMVRPGWNVGDWVLIILSVAAGSMTYGGIMLIRAMVSFFTVESLEIFNVFTNGGLEATCYPMDIYTAWLRNFFTYVIPLSAINYLPMSALLGKGYAPLWASYLSPAMGVAFFCLGFVCWRFGVRRYRSTGS
jgi:ABC-2 type transport system permease protein